MLRHLLETLVLSFYGKKGNTNSIGQLRTFCILLHLQRNVFYPSNNNNNNLFLFFQLNEAYLTGKLNGCITGD